MKRFVLDASVALSWFVDHPTANYARHVRQLLLEGSRAVVPPLWQYEVANGFVVAERRGLATTSETTEALQNLEIIVGHAIESSQEPAPMRRTLATAREFRLTAYDAAYLDLAREQQLPLATLDQHLARVAVQAGTALLR